MFNFLFILWDLITPSQQIKGSSTAKAVVAGICVVIAVVIFLVIKFKKKK